MISTSSSPAAQRLGESALLTPSSITRTQPIAKGFTEIGAGENRLVLRVSKGWKGAASNTSHLQRKMSQTQAQSITDRKLMVSEAGAYTHIHMYTYTHILLHILCLLSIVGD